MRVIGQSCQLARIDFLGAKKRAAAKYGRKCPKTWKVIILGFLEGSHGRMIANKEREWAHIGYWRRQDTIIGLNCSTPPQTETTIAPPSRWPANNFQAAARSRRVKLNMFKQICNESETKVTTSSLENRPNPANDFSLKLGN